MKASILHAPDGRIIAMTMGEASPASPGQLRMGPMVPRKDQHLLHLELSEEQAKKSLIELHGEYQVDVTAGRLVRKPR
jgi:hypothetical protein